MKGTAESLGNFLKITKGYLKKFAIKINDTDPTAELKLELNLYKAQINLCKEVQKTNMELQIEIGLLQSNLDTCIAFQKENVELKEEIERLRKLKTPKKNGTTKPRNAG